MSNHGKKHKRSNLTSKITVPTSGGGKGKKNKKSSLNAMGSMSSYNLPEFTVTASDNVNSIVDNKAARSIIKDLTRVTVDRDGKRS